MTRRANDRKPTITSHGTTQLAQAARRLRVRHPSLDNSVAHIHQGDGCQLLQMIVDAQAGDEDAALMAIWALLPRLCAVVIQRHPVHAWSATIDDYIALSYLTIADVDTAESTAFLADKIIARTRRRYERASRQDRDRPVAVDEPVLEAIGGRTMDVEDRVLARLELDGLLQAVRHGLLTPAAWSNLVGLRVGRSPDRRATDSERTALKRAQRRLDDWRAEAA
jgi:hypothetical protein